MSGFKSLIGCTNRAYFPTFVMSGLATGNTSEYMIQYFQTTNANHWGLYPNGTPLQRLYNPVLQASNRSKMCSSQVSLGPGDSCDEFPFASTYQSGPQVYGPAFNTSLCSQFAPVWNGGLSYTINASPGYSPSQTCARGHVPLVYNTDAGSQLSVFYLSNRMIDRDAFWIRTAS